MKKLSSIALAALMAATLGVSAAAASYDVPTGTAKVDGEKDKFYIGDGIAINLGESDWKEVDAKAMATGTVWTLWDEDNLYCFFDIKDPAFLGVDKVTTNDYRYETIEAYVNFSGEEGAIADINAAQYTWGPGLTEFVGGGKHRADNMADAQTAYTITDDGYTVELAIPFGKDFKAEAGAEFTAVFSINDDTDGVELTREQHMFSAPNTGSAWSTADSAWDTMVLTEDTYVEPAAPTADAASLAVAALAASAAAAVVVSKKRK